MFSFFFVLIGFAMGYWVRKRQRRIIDWLKDDKESDKKESDES